MSIVTYDGRLSDGGPITVSGGSIAVSGGTIAVSAVGGVVSVSPPSPQVAVAITPTNGLDPLAANMVAVALDDTISSVAMGISVINGATAVDIELFMTIRETAEIVPIPGGRRDDLEVNGGMVVDILPQPVGQKISAIGARSYYVGGPPTLVVELRNRKG